MLQKSQCLTLPRTLLSIYRICSTKVPREIHKLIEMWFLKIIINTIKYFLNRHSCQSNRNAIKKKASSLKSFWFSQGHTSLVKDTTHDVAHSHRKKCALSIKWMAWKQIPPTSQMAVLLKDGAKGDIFWEEITSLLSQLNFPVKQATPKFSSLRKMILWNYFLWPCGLVRDVLLLITRLSPNALSSGGSAMLALAKGYWLEGLGSYLYDLKPPLGHSWGSQTASQEGGSGSYESLTSSSCETQTVSSPLQRSSPDLRVWRRAAVTLQKGVNTEIRIGDHQNSITA